VHWGSVTPTAGAAADIYRVCIIPGGLEVTDITVNWADLDTGGTAFAVKIGFFPVDATAGPDADDDYFSVANTFLSGAAGTRFLTFDPIKFERPVILTFTVTVAATTFATGKITAKVYGDGLGIK
jgi:hypothetical protein